MPIVSDFLLPIKNIRDCGNTQSNGLPNGKDPKRTQNIAKTQENGLLH